MVWDFPDLYEDGKEWVIILPLQTEALSFDIGSERQSRVFIFSIRDYAAASLQSHQASRQCSQSLGEK